MLREARRQRRLSAATLPAVCALDPDGDVVRALRAAGRARASLGWACYDADMDVTGHAGLAIGMVGLAAGAPFAVLLAEQLSAAGCQLAIRVTSPGQIRPLNPTPHFVLIDRALRDVKCSGHRPAVGEIGRVAAATDRPLSTQSGGSRAAWAVQPHPLRTFSRTSISLLRQSRAGDGLWPKAEWQVWRAQGPEADVQP